MFDHIIRNHFIERDVGEVVERIYNGIELILLANQSKKTLGKSVLSKQFASNFFLRTQRTVEALMFGLRLESWKGRRSHSRIMDKKGKSYRTLDKSGWVYTLDDLDER